MTQIYHNFNIFLRAFYQGIVKNSDLFTVDEKNEFNQWFYDDKKLKMQHSDFFTEKKSIGYGDDFRGVASKAIMN